MFVIPNKLVIGGFDYAVSKEEHLARDRNSSGESCGNTQTIKLDLSMSEQLQQSTFIHEVLHQIDFVYNIKLDHAQVYLLEAGLYAFLKQNIDSLKKAL